MLGFRMSGAAGVHAPPGGQMGAQTSLSKIKDSPSQQDPSALGPFGETGQWKISEVAWRPRLEVKSQS